MMNDRRKAPSFGQHPVSALNDLNFSFGLWRNDSIDGYAFPALFEPEIHQPLPPVDLDPTLSAVLSCHRPLVSLHDGVQQALPSLAAERASNTGRRSATARLVEWTPKLRQADMRLSRAA